MANANELELIARAKAGDAYAFEQAVSIHLPMLLAYSKMIVGDFHIAQDVVQQTLLVAHRKLNLFFDEADFKSWLRAIANREARDSRKRRVRLGSKCSSLIETAMDSLYTESDGPESTPIGRALGECLQALKGRMSQIVQAHYFQGKRLDEIAPFMGITVNATKQLLYRVRQGLRVCIQRKLGTENF